jgi:hypothetical protein
VRSIRRLFCERYTEDELEQLADLLGRLPGARREGSCTVS